MPPQPSPRSKRKVVRAPRRTAPATPQQQQQQKQKQQQQQRGEGDDHDDDEGEPAPPPPHPSVADTGNAKKAKAPSTTSGPGAAKKKGGDKDKDAESYRLKGNELYAKGRYSEAVAYYTKAVARDPLSAVYLGNRAAARMMLGMYGAALEDCQRSLRIDPEFTKARLRSGQALLKLGRTAEARAAALHVLTTDGSGGQGGGNAYGAAAVAEKRRGSSGGGGGGDDGYARQAGQLLKQADKLAAAEAEARSTLRRSETVVKMPNVGGGGRTQDGKGAASLDTAGGIGSSSSSSSSSGAAAGIGGGGRDCNSVGGAKRRPNRSDLLKGREAAREGVRRVEQAMLTASASPTLAALKARMLVAAGDYGDAIAYCGSALDRLAVACQTAAGGHSAGAAAPDDGLAAGAAGSPSSIAAASESRRMGAAGLCARAELLWLRGIALDRSGEGQAALRQLNAALKAATAVPALDDGTRRAAFLAADIRADTAALRRREDRRAAGNDEFRRER